MSVLIALFHFIRFHCIEYTEFGEFQTGSMHGTPTALSSMGETILPNEIAEDYKGREFGDHTLRKGNDMYSLPKH